MTFPKISANVRLNLLAAFFFASLSNYPLWTTLVSAMSPLQGSSILTLASLWFGLLVLFNLLLSPLLLSTCLQKSILVFLLLCTAFATYFMSSYNVLLDRTMLQNTFETNPAESFELLTPQMIITVLMIGVLPALLVIRSKIETPKWKTKLLQFSLSVLISTLVAAAVILVQYQDFASLFRNNKKLGHLITPTNYLVSLSKYAHQTLTAPDRFSLIGEDATLSKRVQEQPKKTVFVLVLGETARAANFSLNGYSRKTNPKISKLPVINFSKVSSCGTSTAISVPCIFSAKSRSDYDDGLAKHQEGLLDVLQRAGVQVLWKDNNSGCKGACDRVPTFYVRAEKNSPFCTEEECYDEKLLEGLAEQIMSTDKPTVIVLHQKGSHGPSYYLRTPEAYRKFQPVCETAQLQQCQQQEIINAYDNTLLYTDHFLAELIKLLKQHKSEFQSAMLYVSDHGESLGEGNLYLHGMPYLLAPKEQTHVPMLLWLSDSFSHNMRIPFDCLEKKKNKAFSHDNIFHSLLGVMGVETSIYEQELDIFHGCYR